MGIRPLVGNGGLPVAGRWVADRSKALRPGTFDRYGRN